MNCLVRIGSDSIQLWHLHGETFVDLDADHIQSDPVFHGIQLSGTSYYYGDASGSWEHLTC